jgi:hypothetical protein
MLIKFHTQPVFLDLHNGYSKPNSKNSGDKSLLFLGHFGKENYQTNFTYADLFSMNNFRDNQPLWECCTIIQSTMNRMFS